MGAASETTDMSRQKQEVITYNGITAAWETITPEIARAWLEGHVNLRSLSNRAVNVLTPQMPNWDVNGETIKFDGKDNLIDGQHRLQSCISANTPFVSLVVRGIRDALTVDIGTKRTLGQVLAGQGWKNPAQVAAAVRVLWMLDMGQDPYQRGSWHGDAIQRPTLTQLVTHLRSLKRKRLEECSAMGMAMRRLHLCPAGVYTALSYQFLDLSEDVARLFHDALITGENLSKDDPMFVLRRFFLNAPNHVWGTQQGQRVAYGVTVKAWNAVVNNQKVGVLALKDSELLPKPEKPK